MSPEGRGRKLARTFLRAKPEDTVRYGFGAGQSIFTPKNTEIITPLPDQHPYAGWLYLEAKTLVERHDGPIDILTITGGVVGPASLAEEAQRTVHRLINDDDVLGWDNQLSNEPGLIASFDRIWRPMLKHNQSRSSNQVGFDFLPHAGVSAGNVITEARGGVTLRIGTRLDRSYGPARVAPAPPTGGFQSRGGFSWQIFVGAEARGVARKIFLDGNTYRDSLSVDKENFVGELYTGFSVQRNRLQFSYTHTLRTREFKQQNDRLDFGALTLSMAL